MSLEYAAEKFSGAVRTLATHPATMKGRLVEALVGHVASVKLERDVPEDLHDAYREFWGRVTKAGPSSEGSLQATVRQMSMEESSTTCRTMQLSPGR